MRPLATALLALALILFTPVSWAQTQPEPQPAPPSGQNTPLEHGPDAGTAPGGRGSTGWTGGQRAGADDNVGQRQLEDINAQTEYATGRDLKGPPARYRSTQTPE